MKCKCGHPHRRNKYNLEWGTCIKAPKCLCKKFEPIFENKFHGRRIDEEFAIQDKGEEHGN